MSDAVLGNFCIDIVKLTEEKNIFSVFISHAGADTERVKRLEDKMREKFLLPLYDVKYIDGGQAFHPKIHKMMRSCSAAVVLITEKSLSSGWVSYEIGFLTRLGKRIFLYDIDNVLKATVTTPEGGAAILSYDARRGLLSPYFPAYNSEQELLDALAPYAQYVNMLKDDLPVLSRKLFAERIDERVESVAFSIGSTSFAGIEEHLRASRIGTMIVNFGMFHKGNEVGKRCPAEDTPPERCPLCDAVSCPLYGQSTLTDENIECALLNHVLYNGTFYAQEEEMPNGVTAKAPTIRLYLPLHKRYGTEFKMVIDPPSHEAFKSLMVALAGAGMNPTTSDSHNGAAAPRIYLSLPERPKRGLYRLKEDYNNNFICPGAPDDGEDADRADD